MDSRQLHALGSMLLRDSMQRDLSERQSWLLDRVIAELEWRAERDLKTPGVRACVCELCWLGDPHGEPDDLPDL